MRLSSLILWPIKVISYCFGLVIYLTMKVALGPSLRLTGFKKSTIGKCVIFAPLDKMEIILL